MIDERFVILGSILGFIGIFHYLIETIKGKAKPNRVSWFLWALAPLVAFAAEISKGVGIQSLMTFTVGFGPLMVFVASLFNKESQWNLTKMDYIYGGLSLFGLVLWWITGEGILAIFFAIISDGLAAMPTLIKAYHQPETEDSTAFLFCIFNAGITILTISIWDFAHAAFPIYILIMCATLYIVIKFKIGKLQSNTSAIGG